MEEKTPGVVAIHKIVEILRAFTPSSPEIGTRELAQKIGLPKSTVHRYLVALKQEGLVEINPDNSRYRLGLELVAIAGTALRNMDVRHAALQMMNWLAEQWQETIDLDVLSGTQIIIIEQIAGQHILSTGGTIANRMPAYCTSTGKVLLAYAGPDYVLEHFPEELPKLTRDTITSRSSLLKELEQVRRQGYARSWGEHEEYVHALAVPIHNLTGKVVAALSISGLAVRIDDNKAEKMLKNLKSAARDISAGLGFVDR